MIENGILIDFKIDKISYIFKKLKLLNLNFALPLI